MADKTELLLEAERRGILPADKKPLLDEARRRGLIPGGGASSSAPTPAPQEPGLADRFNIMARDAFEQSGLGTVLRRNRSGQAEFDQVGDMDAALGAMSRGERVPPQNPYARVPRAALERARDQALVDAGRRRDEFMPAETARRAEVEALPSFADDPTLLGKVQKGAVNLGAMLLGGAPSPENLVPVGRGATLGRTFLKGAGVNAAINVPTDVVAQQQDVQLGLQDQYDPTRTAIAAAIGAATGGAVNVVPDIARGAAKGIRRVFEPSAQQVDPSLPALPSRVDTPDVNTMYVDPAGRAGTAQDRTAMDFGPDVARAADTTAIEGQFRRIQDPTAEPARTALPYDDTRPILADGSRPDPAEWDAIQARQQEMQDTGLTPDVLAAQRARDNPTPDTGVQMEPDVLRRTVGDILADRTIDPRKTVLEIIQEATGVRTPPAAKETKARAADVKAAMDEPVGIKQSPDQLEEPLTAAEAMDRQAQARRGVTDPAQTLTPEQMGEPPAVTRARERGSKASPQSAAPDVQQPNVGPSVQEKPAFTKREQAPETNARPEPESDQTRSEAAAAENFGRVTGDIKGGSTNDLWRASHYASSIITNLQKKAQRGEPHNADMLRSLEVERDAIKAEWLTRSDRFSNGDKPLNTTSAPEPRQGVSNEKHAPDQSVRQTNDVGIGGDGSPERGVGQDGARGEPQAQVDEGSNRQGGRQESAAPAEEARRVDEGGDGGEHQKTPEEKGVAREEVQDAAEPGGRPRAGVDERARVGEGEAARVAAEGNGGSSAKGDSPDSSPFGSGEAKLYDFGAAIGEGITKAARWALGGDYTEAKGDLTKIAAAVKTMFESKGKPKPGEGDPRNIGKQLFDAMFASAHGDMIGLYNKFKARGADSPTFKRILDQTFARAGTGEGTGRTFDEAYDARVKRQLNKVDDISDAMKAANVTDEQVWRQVTNQAARQGQVGKIAKMVEDFFGESLKYQRDAGADIGESKNYFRRIVDRNKAYEQRAKFVDQAAKVYTEDQGLSAVDAKKAAEAYWHRVVYGVEGRPGMPGRSGTEKFAREREFGPAAEKHLGDFYRKDIIGTLAEYATQSARRAEIARLWGDNFSRWTELESAMKKEGVGDALPQLRDYVEMIAGVKQFDVSKIERIASSWSRTWFSLGSLTWATMTSLPELVMPVVRANMDVKVAWNGYIGYLKEALKAAPGRDANYFRRLNEDIGLVAGAHYGALSAQRFGTESAPGSYQSRAIEKFFARNLLEPLTNFNRDLSTAIAEPFIAKQAGRAFKGDKLAARELADLGVDAAAVKEFSTWVNGMKGKAPSFADLQAAGKNGDLYMLALQRFSDQSVMRPTAATKAKGANNPGVIGLLYHLQSFNYAYSKNVLGRAKNRVMGEDVSGMDRMRYGLQALSGMAMITALQYALGEARDSSAEALTGKKKDVTYTPAAKVERALSRAGAFGVADPYLQMLSGVRYQRPISSAAGGPVIGTGFDMAQTGVNMWLNNSENTNSAERRFARNLYRYGVEPGVNLALTSLPINPATALVTMVALPAMRESFVDDLAGEHGRQKPREIQGLSEVIAGKAKSGRSSGRESGRSSGR